MSNPHLETQESEQEDYIFNPVQQQSKNKVKFDRLVHKVGTAFHPNSETEQAEAEDSEMSQQRISQREMERNQRENIKLERRMKTIQVSGEEREREREVLDAEFLREESRQCLRERMIETA